MIVAAATVDALPFVGSFAISLVMTFLIVPWLIPKLKANGIVGKDRNKLGSPDVAEMGGISVVIGFFGGISLLLASDGATNETILNMSLSVILGAAFIGLIDDLFDLRQSLKAFFPFLLALPFGIALDSVVYLPFIGEVDFGVTMIIAAPFAITCAANAGNMLEGFNGLGTGLGIIMSSTLISLAIVHQRYDGLYLLVPLLGALLAFLWFNKYPSRIFPGDTLMLFMGTTIAVAGMLSDLHFQTGFIFIPMITEFFLKWRGRFKAENYASGTRDGHLEYVGRIESVTHILMKHGSVTEKSLTVMIWTIEAAFCAVVVAGDLIV
jgi:UDP-N-acetylglucosamine--dolichyl-phosphate N-acetylglucosaminephosphotransferase